MKKRFAALGLAVCLALVFTACDYVDQAMGLVKEMMGDSSSVSAVEQDTRSWQQRVEDAVAVADALPVGQADSVKSWYEVYVYSFCDADADGIGDIAGLTAQLDYIQYLGFEGIVLMPVFPAPSADKYDVTNYLDVDVQYGTLKGFDSLMAESSQRGLDIMMDLPITHTSSQHGWFTQAVAALAAGSTNDAAVGYYYFSQEDGGDGWHAVPGAEGWWYRGSRGADKPDLDLQNTGLRAELEKIMVFWMNRGVQGFRLGDAKTFVPGDDAAGTAVLQWATGIVKAMRQSGCVVAACSDGSEAYYGYYASGADGVLNLPFAGAAGTLAKTVLGSTPAGQYGEAVVNVQAMIAQSGGTGADAPYLTTHDSDRAAGFLQEDAKLVKMAWAMNLLQGGNAFVYYGEELGMAGSGADANRQAPMYWSDTPGVFGVSVGPPEMEKPAHKFPPAMEQIDDEGSILNFIRQANAVRRQYPAIARGTARVESMGGIPLALERVWGEQAVLVVYNPTAEEATGTVPGAYGSAALGAALSVTGAQPALEGGTLTLPAYSIAVLEVPVVAADEGDGAEGAEGGEAPAA